MGYNTYATKEKCLTERWTVSKKQTFIFYRGMAQFGSALDWGSRGHGFKSRYSDHKLR